MATCSEVQIRNSSQSPLEILSACPSNSKNSSHLSAGRSSFFLFSYVQLLSLKVELPEPLKIDTPLLRLRGFDDIRSPGTAKVSGLSDQVPAFFVSDTLKRFEQFDLLWPVGGDELEHVEADSASGRGGGVRRAAGNRRRSAVRVARRLPAARRGEGLARLRHRLARWVLWLSTVLPMQSPK